MNNLFIVQSPFQLLSAIEAANYFRADRNTLVVCYVGEENNNAQINQLVKLYSNWCEVMTISPSKSNFLTGIKALRLLKEMANARFNPQRIFIGEYRSWYMPHFFQMLNPQECFLLDDGNVTIELQKNYLLENRPYGLAGVKSWIKRGVVNLLLGANKNEKRLIHLFTNFDLKQFSPQQQVIQHSFEFIRSSAIKKRIDKTTIYFFGGPISELGLLPLTRELVLIDLIKKHYEAMDLKMSYIPHRRDTQEKIELIAGKLKIEVIRFDSPAEVELVSRATQPCGIASFYSTTLLTLPKISSFEYVDAFKLPISELPEVYRLEIESVYSKYDTVMRVIDIA